MRIKGVNLGNWLVLEKWMSPALFYGTDARDEYELPRALSKEAYENRIRIHRAEYITERDFIRIRAMGLNMVRIPVPFFVFGDVEPYIGCIEELDKAFAWAKRYGLKILIDLHTVPGGQNGFDNSGLCGVLKWPQKTEYVDFTISVLERLCQRYGRHEALFGIEPVNEPMNQELWEAAHVQLRYPPKDPKMAEGSGGITWDFLCWFYVYAYEHMRKYLPTDKAIVLHDAFNLHFWKGFMREERFENVWLDTHLYLMNAEQAGCQKDAAEYTRYVMDHFYRDVEEMDQYMPVICGEWSLFNSLGTGQDTSGGRSILNGLPGVGRETVSDKDKRELYRLISRAQLAAWNKCHGYFFWSYKLLIDTVNDPDWIGWDAWDLGRAYDLGWFPKQDNEE